MYYTYKPYNQVHGGIRHLERKKESSKMVTDVHGGIRHLEN
ncbi:hypothetical protein ACINNAV82_2768 [Acinetobacter baumannii Naval-82]|nr:hypothetical protein ACINNAV82_2768 [Acinetobacter baumannii Naval-82]